MKASGNGIRKRVPIRRHFLTIILLTTIISILAASITGFLCIRWIHALSEETLTEQLEINLKNIIQEKVNSADAKLTHYEKYIEYMKDSLALLYADEEKSISSGRVFGPPRETHEYELTRAFSSEEAAAEEYEREMRFFSHMEMVWEPIAKENEGLVTTLYLGTKDGLMVSYDRYSYLSCPPEGKEAVYNYFTSEWYGKGMSEEGVFCTGVYMDSAGRGLTITIGSAFEGSGRGKAGVICMDFDLSALYEELFSGHWDDGSFAFFLDQQNNIISPDADTLDLQEYTGLTLDELESLREDTAGILEKDDQVYVCVPLEHVGWTMFARVPYEAVQEGVHEADLSIGNAVAAFLVIVLAVLLAAVIAVNKSVRDITYPLELLERDIKIISEGNLSYRATVYRNDEIGDITSGINEMVDRLNFTMNELLSSQQQADAMSRLATLDALTGMRNKTAFDRQSKLLTEGLERGEKEFGLVMIDLNNLKVINDNYGHEKGDIAIKNLCAIMCEVFPDAPVFRVGGDEFVVLIQNENYAVIDSLVQRFQDRIREVSLDDDLSPWDSVSAAIGYAVYDEKLDSTTANVLARADQKMYICKKKMKSQ